MTYLQLDHIRTNLVSREREKSFLKMYAWVINQFTPEAVLTHKICLCRWLESVLTHIPIFACSGCWLVNTPLVAWHHKFGWHVYTHLLLGVNSTTAKWFRTIGTANNEWVHSFCSFLPNPFIEHLFCWRSSHGFVKTDLYPLYRGILIDVRDMSFRPCACWRVGRCFELANGLILPKKDDRNKKTSH